MDFESYVEALLWSYGIYPQLTGKQYLIYILKKIHSGSEITPLLLTETAAKFGKSRSSVYSALNIVRGKIIGQSRTTGNDCPPLSKNSFYHFLYWFYQKATKSSPL